MTTVYYNADADGVLKVADSVQTGSWISVMGPDDVELDLLADTYKLDRDLLGDAVDIYEAPRIEKDGSNVYVYTRYCYPQGKEIATEPLLLIITSDYLISVMRADTSILNRFTSGAKQAQTTKKTQLVMQIMEEINNSYQLQLNSVSKQILRIRAMLRQSQISNRDFVGMIELEEDLNEFLAALHPQATLLGAFTTTKYLRLHEEDKELIEDLILEARELIELTKSRLRTLVNIRQAYDAIATNNLNNTFKRLTSIAIFMAVPTIIGGFWGMNVHVPFFGTAFGFWFVLGLTSVVVALFVWFFRSRKWF
ncbi:MAG: mg2 transporter protein CorA family protein magnesium transporter [Marmoricola sp.]|nr:mg2 transporter protein CorA family protein magnesium transporter [Marmoricola sp.]